MIISHRYRFIFIKTRKTAGTSIELFLSGVCGADAVVTPIFPPISPHTPRNFAGFYNHMPAAAIEAAAPAAWRDYLTFCVERNPWDKLLSAYFMYRNSTVHGGDGTLSLSEYLASGEFPLNAPLYTIGGNIAVDRVLRYEALDAELAEIFAVLGVPYPGRLPFRAKSEWRDDRRPYREVLSGAQAARIATLFAEEIRLHGYTY